MDQVQKRLEVPDAAIQALKRKGLVEGRRPNLRVSAAVAAASSQQAKYIKTSAFDDQHYADLVLKSLSKFGSASRKQIDELLWDKLSDALNDAQKKSKIGNILTRLRVDGAIFNAGSRAAPDWKASE